MNRRVGSTRSILHACHHPRPFSFPHVYSKSLYLSQFIRLWALRPKLHLRNTIQTNKTRSTQSSYPRHRHPYHLWTSVATLLLPKAPEGYGMLTTQLLHLRLRPLLHLSRPHSQPERSDNNNSKRSRNRDSRSNSRMRRRIQRRLRVTHLQCRKGRRERRIKS